MTVKVPVDIFADIICPWCFIGKRRLTQAVAEHGGVTLAITPRAFLLNPTMPKGGMDRQAYIEGKFGSAGAGFYDRIAEVGKGDGIDFRFDLIRRTPDSRPAHALVLNAASNTDGDYDGVMEDLFEAYFIKGLDIGADAVLEDIADRHNLPYPSPKAVMAQIDRDLAAANQLGISGVPFFLFDGEYGISGAHEPKTFLPLFDAVIARQN